MDETTSTNPTPVQITLTIDSQRSERLRTSGMRSFLADQPDRFENLCDPGPDRSSNAGTFYWCPTGADLLILEAYEQARGRRTYLLTDLSDYTESGLVLLSIDPNGGGLPEHPRGHGFVENSVDRCDLG